MRTILRNSSTGLYFAGAGSWTADPAAARDFRLIDRALDFIAKWRLRDVRVAFAFRNGKRVFDVPPRRLGVKFSEE